MLGLIVLLAALGIEIGLMIYCLKNTEYQNNIKHIIRLTSLGLFGILILSPVIEWSFRWYLLLAILLLQSLFSIVFLVRRAKTNKLFQKKRVVTSCILRCLLLTIAIIPALMFPQYEPITVTGEYPVKSTSYTLTDPNRVEHFSNTNDQRNITIQFWYPETDKGETFPLVIFSHGSFGFRGSNYSTFMELASNGYVVCSIDHTYQAFYTKQTDGKMITVNTQFLNDAMAVQAGAYDDEKTYRLTKEWLKLRSDDMNFVLDTILYNTKGENGEEVYQKIDANRIGLLGHSLGGATAAVLGRERKDIDAAIVIDGTMIGEEVDYVDGKAVLNKEPFPIPILNIYNEEHFAEASANAENYANMVASTRALEADQTVFKGAGHLNFTDLPLFSPFLAQQLGTGDIDKRYCVETMNRVVLDYFNCFLKDAEKPNILPKYQNVK